MVGSPSPTAAGSIPHLGSTSRKTRRPTRRLRRDRPRPIRSQQPPNKCHPRPRIWVAESVQADVRAKGGAGEIPANRWWAHVDSNHGPLPYQRSPPISGPSGNAHVTAGSGRASAASDRTQFVCHRVVGGRFGGSQGVTPRAISLGYSDRRPSEHPGRQRRSTALEGMRTPSGVRHRMGGCARTGHRRVKSWGARSMRQRGLALLRIGGAVQSAHQPEQGRNVNQKSSVSLSCRRHDSVTKVVAQIPASRIGEHEE